MFLISRGKRKRGANNNWREQKRSPKGRGSIFDAKKRIRKAWLIFGKKGRQEVK